MSDFVPLTTKKPTKPTKKRTRLFAFGERTDTQARLDAEDLAFKQKWQKDYEEGTLVIGPILRKQQPTSKSNRLKNRRAILVDGQILVVETCIICLEEKPLTPAYYKANKRRDRCNPLARKSGGECMNNSMGCSLCAAATKARIVDPNEYIRNLLSNYPHLSRKWYDGSSERCTISNIELVRIPNAEWRASIQNNGPTQEHFEEHCTKICFEFNVAQYKAIPCLLTAWIECFRELLKELREPTDTTELVSQFKKWWSNTPKENGVTAPSKIYVDGKSKNNPLYQQQMITKHLRSMLQFIAKRHRESDKVSKRVPATAGEYLTTEDIFSLMIKQACKCFNTGIPISLHRDNWRYWSVERLDNSKNHTVENCVLVCRLFNTRGQLNRRKILTALLSQIHVPVSDEDRVMIASHMV